jgi:hypothetical protein
MGVQAFRRNVDPDICIERDSGTEEYVELEQGSKTGISARMGHESRCL